MFVVQRPIRTTSCPLQLTKVSRAAVEQNRVQADQQDDDEIDTGVQAVGGSKRHNKYLNEDLPGYPGTLRKFRDHVLPRWYLYISKLDNPWDLHHPDHVYFSQILWDRYVEVRHDLALKNEPVFALVSEDNLGMDDIDIDFI